MPRPFGGKRSVSPALNVDLSNIASRLAVAFAALVLALTFPASPTFAASDDEPDTGITNEEDTAAAASALESKSGTHAWGGLTVEGLVYWREDLPNFAFTKLTSGGASYVKFDSSDLEGETYAPGLRISLKAAILDQPFELSAFYLTPMGVEATKQNLTDTDATYHEAPGFDFSSVNSEDMVYLTVHQETKLFGAEANLVQPLGIPGLVFGARAIDFGEELGSMTARQADDVPGGTDNDRDHVSVRTDNRLLGLQIGFENMFDVGDNLRVGGSIKAGLYNNFVDRNRTFVSENVVNLRSFETTDHDNVFAQSVEINPRIELKLSEGAYLTASGQFLWLNNVSTALPSYASVTNLDDHDVRANDDVYFYGGSLGMTVLLDQSSPTSNSLPPFPPVTSGASHADMSQLDERVAELEETTARKGNDKVTFSVSGWINRMLLAWDDGDKKDVYVVDNTASRSRINFEGAAQIARGWSAGYLLSLGLDVASANDVDQFITNDDSGIELRHSAWWIRNDQLGTVTVGHTSTATDNIILKDVGGIMPGAANLGTIGGGLLLRHADSYGLGSGALVSSGAYTTTLNEMVIGASVDTLRRNVVRYDAPRISGQWGNVDLSGAWGEDDFFDVALEHSVNYDDWKFRFGAGYLHDTTDAHDTGHRDRREYKGSASLLHIPTGLFATAAYVRRTFHGSDPSNQSIYGENVVADLDPSRPNRPPTDYFYSAFGLRRAYWPIGDTSIYGEYAQVYDSIKGLREADLKGVTDSRTMMLGAAICQDVEAAGLDIYAGFRVYQFDVKGIQTRSNKSYISPVPLADIVLGYAGTRIKF